MFEEDQTPALADRFNELQGLDSQAAPPLFSRSENCLPRGYLAAGETPS